MENPHRIPPTADQKFDPEKHIKTTHTEGPLKGKETWVRKTAIESDKEAAEEAMENQNKIETALAKLSPVQRTALIMREKEGKTYTEIAEAMKCSKGTVMARLFHARRHMQKYLSESEEQKKPIGGIGY